MRYVIYYNLLSILHHLFIAQDIRFQPFHQLNLIATIHIQQSYVFINAYENFNVEYQLQVFPIFDIEIVLISQCLWLYLHQQLFPLFLQSSQFLFLCLLLPETHLLRLIMPCRYMYPIYSVRRTVPFLFLLTLLLVSQFQPGQLNHPRLPRPLIALNRIQRSFGLDNSMLFGFIGILPRR